MVAEHQMTIGLFTAYLAYRSHFVTALASLMDKWGDYHVLRLHLGKLNDIVMHQQEVAPPPLLWQAQASLALQDVGFNYHASEAPLFKQINLNIEAGEIVAITGASGSGKTTLLKIMMGLLPPTTGQLCMNNIAVYPQHMLSYRHHIAGVSQNDVLLSGSIFENISFFDENPDVDRVYQSAAQAAIYREIMAFPMGFMTRVGDMGALLSGGQKQRILLARALYAQPRILFLDEATSHLDLQKEREVNASIRRWNLTTVLVAHRQETIAMSDRVFSLT